MKTIKYVKYAIYNGKRYDIEYIGQTKYGERAKLKFTNGTQTFWVDVGKIHVVEEKEEKEENKKKKKKSYEEDDIVCPLCGENKYTCGHCIGW